MNNPIVSIIIPTYNRAHLISETLDSVIAQTYTNWECIVVDDGSTDDTLEVLKEYANRDARIQYHSRPKDRPKGANACRNYGFELSKGEYVNFLDSDDILSINKLDFQISIVSSKNADIALCGWAFFNDLENFNKSKVTNYKDFSSGIELLSFLGKKSTYVPLHVYLVNSKVVKRAGKWNERLKINQDGEFFTRVLINSKEIYTVNECLVYYRRSHGNNVSSYKIEVLKDIIISWNLIALHCKPHIDSEVNFYVNNSKKRIFNNLIYNYPFFVLRNISFFKEVFMYKVKRKLKI